MFGIFIKKEPNRIRSFTDTTKKQVFYNQKGLCNICQNNLDIRNVVYDHIVRYSQGGESIISNCQALCPNCHGIKTFNENLEISNPS